MQKQWFTVGPAEQSEQIVYSRAALSIQSCGVHVTDYKPDWRHWWQLRLRNNSDVWGRGATIPQNCSTQAGFNVIRNMIYDGEIISAGLKKN